MSKKADSTPPGSLAEDAKAMANLEDVVPTGTHPQGSTVPPHGDDHEYRDISFRTLYQAIIMIMGMIVVAALACFGLFRLLDSNTGRPTTPMSPMTETVRNTRGPQLQAEPRADMVTYRGHEDSVLNSYGWSDSIMHVARIPISRAIDIVAQRGLAYAGGTIRSTQTVATPPVLPAPADSTSRTADTTRK
jgi:hypothetical protein